MFLMKWGSSLLVKIPSNVGPQLMWYSLFTCQCTSNTTMVSTPSARQRRSISLWPSMAASRQPKFGPGNSDRYIDGTCVILAARARVPIARSSALGGDVGAADHHRIAGDLRLDERGELRRRAAQRRDAAVLEGLEHRGRFQCLVHFRVEALHQRVGRRGRRQQ